MEGGPVGVVAVSIRPEGMEDRSVGGVERGRVEWPSGFVRLEKPGKGFVKASGPGGVEREEGLAPFVRELVGIDGGCPSEVVAGRYEDACDDGAGVADEAGGRTGGMPEVVVGLIAGGVEAPSFGYGGADEVDRAGGDFG